MLSNILSCQEKLLLEGRCKVVILADEDKVRWFSMPLKRIGCAYVRYSHSCILILNAFMVEKLTNSSDALAERQTPKFAAEDLEAWGFQ